MPRSEPDSRTKVLIVDDDVDILHAVELYLQAGGFEVATAKSGGEALRLVRGFTPDVIVLDLLMPGMSGTELMVRLREAGVLVPIIVITADAEAPRRLKGSRQHGLLVKPFNFADLRDAVARAAAPPAATSEAGARR